MEETPAVTPETLNDPTPEDLSQEVNFMKDQLLRALAEADNVRKRAQKDREEAHRFALTSFARDLLAVVDNLGRALSHSGQNITLDALIEGVKITQNELAAILERHGIQKIAALGNPFNPHLHQAMVEEVSDPQVEPGTVLSVLQEGYLIHDRLLRPALVTVAKSSANSPPSSPGTA